MFEKYLISDHVIERYCERVDECPKDVIKRIKNDLYFKKIKQIITNGNVKHVFTFNSKEFIFVKERSKWVLKTVIKRTRERNPGAIQKRKREAVFA